MKKDIVKQFAVTPVFEEDVKKNSTKKNVNDKQKANNNNNNNSNYNSNNNNNANINDNDNKDIDDDGAEDDEDDDDERKRVQSLRRRNVFNNLEQPHLAGDVDDIVKPLPSSSQKKQKEKEKEKEIEIEIEKEKEREKEKEKEKERQQLNPVTVVVGSEIDVNITPSPTEFSTLPHNPAVEQITPDPNAQQLMKSSRTGQLLVRIVNAKNLLTKALGSANPFVSVSFDDRQERTKTVLESLKPEWNEEFTFDVTSNTSVLEISVWHEDFYCKYDNFMGRVEYPISNFIAQKNSEDNNNNNNNNNNNDNVFEITTKLNPAKDTVGRSYGEITLYIEYKPAPPEKLSPSDFTLLNVLGRGTYGKVLQVRKRDTGALYAMKVMRKEVIISRQKSHNIQMEKTVLQSIVNPFIVRLRYSFQTDAKLYLVLDYMPGGELFFHLKKLHRFSEDQVRFYLCEIGIALGHLHQHEIIYRDLKPENILLDSTGHVRLTDFGLCKKIDTVKGTRTFCGTPEYLAPEVVRGDFYTLAVDWWCVGVLMFEMLSGLPPFYSKNKKEMYENILHKKLLCPAFLSNEAKSLLESLLQRDPSLRLNTFSDFKNHSFFANIDWEMIFNKKISPPLQPHVTHATDTTNFDPRITGEFPKDTYVESKISRSQQEVFTGFSYNEQQQQLK